MMSDDEIGMENPVFTFATPTIISGVRYKLLYLINSVEQCRSYALKELPSADLDVV